MDHTVPNGAENGRVLALAAVAAGVVGGLLAAFTGRRDRTPPKGRVTVSVSVPPGLAESAKHIREDVGAAVSEQLARAAERGKNAQKTAKVGQKKMNKRKARKSGAQMVTGITQSINPLHHEPKSPAKKTAESARQQVQQLTRQGSDLTIQAKQKLDQITHQSQGSLGDLRQRTVELAHAGAGKAQESARTLSQTASERGQDVKSNVKPQVEALKSNLGTVTPQAKALRSTASDRVEELVAEGRERAAKLIKEAEADVLPAAKQFAAQALESLEKLPDAVAEELPGVKEKTDQLKSTASARASSAQQQVAGLTSAATDRASAVQQQAGDKTKQVATVTTEGGKDLGATVTWLALGGGLIYFVFLDDHQREQVRNVANRLFGRVINTYRDIQGFDQEFA